MDICDWFMDIYLVYGFLLSLMDVLQLFYEWFRLLLLVFYTSGIFDLIFKQYKKSITDSIPTEQPQNIFFRFTTDWKFVAKFCWWNVSTKTTVVAKFVSVVTEMCHLLVYLSVFVTGETRWSITK